MRALLPLALLLSVAAHASGFGGSSPGFSSDGLCGVNMSCEVASLTSAATVQSNAASGAYAFKVANNGAKVGVGTGQAYWDAADANTMRTYATIRAEGGIDMRGGGLSNSYLGSIRIFNTGGITHLAMPSPWECSNTTSESAHKVESGTLAVIAGSTGKRPRLCFCGFDGTTYAWENMHTHILGTATTCPEAP